MAAKKQKQLTWKQEEQQSIKRAEAAERVGVIVMERAFNKQEYYEHAQALAEYEDEQEYVSVKSRSNRAKELAGFKEFVTTKCDNIALEVDNRGGFCNRCGEYHFKYNRTGAIVKCSTGWDPYRNRDCMSVGEQPVGGRINVGKYESDWTTVDDEEAYGPDEPEEKPDTRTLAQKLIDEAIAENDEYFKNILKGF